MSQVSLMPVDIAVSPELQGAEVSGMSSFQNEDKQSFADFMKRQINAEKANESKSGSDGVDTNNQLSDELSANEGSNHVPTETEVTSSHEITGDQTADSEKASLQADSKYILNDIELPDDITSTESKELLSMLVASEKLLKSETTPVKPDLLTQRVNQETSDELSDDVMAKLSEDEKIIGKLAGQKGKAQVEHSLNQLSQQFAAKTENVESNTMDSESKQVIKESKVVEAKPLSEAELKQLAQQALGRAPTINAAPAKQVEQQSTPEELAKIAASQLTASELKESVAEDELESNVPKQAEKSIHAASLMSQMNLAKSNESKLSGVDEDLEYTEQLSEEEAIEIAAAKNQAAFIDAENKLTGKQVLTNESAQANAKLQNPESIGQPVNTKSSVLSEESNSLNKRIDSNFVNQPQQVSANIDTKTASQSASIIEATQSKVNMSENVNTTDIEQAVLEENSIAEEVNIKPEIVLKEGAKQASVNNQASLAASGLQTQTTSQAHNATSESYQSQVSAAQAEALASRQQTDTVSQVKQPVQLNETINVYSKDFSKSIKEKVMVMVNQKLQVAEIRLDPPELGNMHVRVNLQNEVAAVQFLVQNQQAKEALEQHMGKLKDMLSESGVDVGDAHVAQQERQFDQSGQSNDGGSAFAGGTGEQESTDELSVDLHSVVKGSAVGVDFYA